MKFTHTDNNSENMQNSCLISGKTCLYAELNYPYADNLWNEIEHIQIICGMHENSNISMILKPKSKTFQVVNQELSWVPFAMQVYSRKSPAS
jgi:hypothetical protein